MPLKTLLLPGYACTSQIWQELEKNLPADFSLTAVDWPHHLLSEFEKIADFSTWLEKQYDLAQFDLLIAHSMGGLIAIETLEHQNLPGFALCLVESFPAPPGPFFRNLLLPGSDLALVSQINGMLEAERPFYSQKIASELGQVNYFERLKRAQFITRAIYGDRGCSMVERVRQELDWPQVVSERIPMRIVADACHFPMLENPPICATAIIELFKPED